MSGEPRIAGDASRPGTPEPIPAQIEIRNPKSAMSPGCVASESAAAGTPDIGATSLSILLSRHVLRDGETVLLVIRPSVWFIVLTSLQFLAITAILMIGARLLGDERLPGRVINYHQAGVVLMIGRLLWAGLQWMGRIHILTDLRALRMSGVARVRIEDCPLRKIARVRLVRPLRERVAFAGTIEIIPFDDQHPIQFWQTINRPRHVHAIINQAVLKARQGPT